MGFINKLITKFIGTKDERDIKKLQPLINAINEMEEEISALNDNQLKAKTEYFKNKLAQGASLDDILVEAFAVVREAGKRVLKMRHYDVQLVGGIVLHRGTIAEMKTGEGKTLVATLPAYLNALTGKGVHIVTVNDYLASRDAEWMGPLYEFLGLKVGVIQAHMDSAERQVAYNADITFGQNNEFGFDYLRDNMKFDLKDYVQRKHNFAIVDEVDSILIDEARTPLIISGPAEASTDVYYQVDRIIPKLSMKIVTGKMKSKMDDTPDTDEEDFDYLVDEKSKTATLTERGVARCEELLGVENLFSPDQMSKVHHINQALKAHALFKKDVDYVVNDGQVIIVDEFTGRLMDGRRWSDGLHQAVEAKENLQIARENQTLATITFQNYFRMYEKLSGMTGTASTEAEEFDKIYSLDVVSIPTNKPLVRVENPDVVYKTLNEKVDAIVGEVADMHRESVVVGDTQWTGRPVLVGTVSIEKSELLSKHLSKKGVPHNVLNAKFHENEAEIVAQAGKVGAVTIATNMAGRGTDILLGGNPEFQAKLEIDPEEAPEKYQKRLEELKKEWEQEHEAVIQLGGLHIVGTERHESRRIDNQLRGRSGRQGDPGSSRFFLSFDDDLMRIFGLDKKAGMLESLGMGEGVPLEHSMITRAIERSQVQVEQHNFSIRKHLLEYDDVMNAQRTSVYTMRRQVLAGETGKEVILEKASDILDWIIDETIGSDDEDNWDYESCAARINDYFAFGVKASELMERDLDELTEELRQKTESFIEAKEKEHGEEQMANIISFIILNTIDELWKDHLYQLDHLKEGIGLRGYGGRQPLVEFKKESFDLFTRMQEEFENRIIKRTYSIQIQKEEAPDLLQHEEQEMFFGAPEPSKRKKSKVAQIRSDKKVGRNDPCPCGSGKKYKKCCMNKTS
jgi:preprotein translocase subunit SecA